MIDTILDNVVIRIEELLLELSDVTVPVVKGKHPVQEDGTEEANTQITVCAAQVPRTIRRFNNQSDLHTYRLQAVYWTPGSRDNTTNLPTLSDWEETIGQAFRRRPEDLIDLDGLRDVRSAPSVFLDRGGFVQGWDVSAIDIELDIIRDRPAP